MALNKLKNARPNKQELIVKKIILLLSKENLFFITYFNSAMSNGCVPDYYKDESIKLNYIIYIKSYNNNSLIRMKILQIIFSFTRLMWVVVWSTNGTRVLPIHRLELFWYLGFLKRYIVVSLLFIYITFYNIIFIVCHLIYTINLLLISEINIIFKNCVFVSTQLCGNTLMGSCGLMFW